MGLKRRKLGGGRRSGNDMVIVKFGRRKKTSFVIKSIVNRVTRKGIAFFEIKSIIIIISSSSRLLKSRLPWRPYQT